MEETSPEPQERIKQVRYRHSPSFVDVLRDLRSTLLISTYQAGKLVTVGIAQEQLQFSFHQFDQAMGVAVTPQRMAVGAKGQIWFLQNNPDIAASLPPAGCYRACYLARSAQVTGSIHCHEIHWSGDELWVVNTLFSCLSTLHPEFNFVPRWRPPFITELIGQDRCHLNGLAMQEGNPRFVTMMAESNEPAGWRPSKSSSGCILDVASGQGVTRGLAMPHSPRWYQDRLWVLNSGLGSLEVVHLQTGQRDTVAKMPGYTRGLAFLGPYAFIGLSRIRETAVFGGVPIAEHRHELKCGVGVVDLRSGNTIATLEFQSGVEEIFDVQLVPGAPCTYVCGPRPDHDDAQDIWVVPRPDQVDAVLRRQAHHGRSFSPASRETAGGERAEVPSAAELVQQALALQAERRVAEALELFQHAARLEPHSAEILNHLGNALQDVDRQTEAIEVYRRAASVDPGFGPAQQNLGYVLVAQGFTDEGLTHLAAAQRVQPNHVNRILLAASLPIVYASREDLTQWRMRLIQGVDALAKQGLIIDAGKSLLPTNFFAVYQGENDCQLHSQLGQIYQGIDMTVGRRRTTRSRYKVGFVSAYFRDHTIGRLNLGRIQHLSRDDFEVVVLSVGQHGDPMAQQFAAAADQYVRIPRDVAQARTAIAQQDLDLLFFTDVGMDALTYSLAFSRMAPVQCVTWGHPVTTGSPHMDYFLSSDLLETAEGAEHYREKLVRRDTLCTYYYRPGGPIPGVRSPREEFGLPASSHLYVCPQTLFKFHPEFDTILADILRRDHLGHLVLIEGRVPNWTKLLRERFDRVMPDVGHRIHFLPAVPHEKFLQLLASADVMLDPIHFGGGNTSYEALAVATPLVTWPGPYLRSRITYALYAKMNFLDLVVNHREQYVSLAVELGTNAEYRQQVREKIKLASGVLFEDLAEVRDLEQFLRDALTR